MWRKLRKQIAVEREMLDQLLADFRPLLHKCAATPPDRIEVSALAALLHGFYNGVENIFKRVALTDEQAANLALQCKIKMIWAKEST